MDMLPSLYGHGHAQEDRAGHRKKTLEKQLAKLDKVLQAKDAKGKC